jgi:hypothetical protein
MTLNTLLLDQNVREGVRRAKCNKEFSGIAENKLEVWGHNRRSVLSP